MAVGGNFERGKWKDCVGWVKKLSGSQTWGMVVLVRRLFNIMASLSLMKFPVVLVSYLKVIILVYFLSNSC